MPGVAPPQAHLELEANSWAKVIRATFGELKLISKWFLIGEKINNG